MSTSILSDFKIDLKRCFFSYKFIVSVIFIASMYELSSNTFYHGEENVITKICNISTFGLGGLLIWSGMVYSSVNVLCEEFEERFYIQMIMRNGKNKYIFSKMSAIFLVSFTSILLGYIVFVSVNALGLEIFDKNSITEFQSSLYYDMLENGKQLGFICAYGVQLATLGGVLGNIALAFSLFTRNQMLIFVSPVVYLYIQDILCIKVFGHRIGSCMSLNSAVFNSLADAIFGQSWQNAYAQLFITMVFVGCVIVFKFNKKLSE